MVDTSGRKWIAREVAKLDPYDDYAEIIKIMTIYRADDAFMDFIDGVTFPNFIIGNHGAEGIFREGKGKAIRHMDQTSQHILIGCEHGPDRPNTVQSIESTWFIRSGRSIIPVALTSMRITPTSSVTKPRFFTVSFSAPLQGF